MSLWVVVGGQYGSEGKGKVSAFITKQENIDICVRCGGPNSGHSLTDEYGKTIILRQVPTGFVNPRTRLLVPAGALIDPVVLKREIEFLELPADRIGIDRKCFVIEEKDREKEQSLGLRERLSSTLCGVGAAQSRRIMRGEDARLAKDVSCEHAWLAKHLTDVSAEVNAAIDRGKKVLIEGTQGFGLSLFHSDHYPKTTSRDTTASGFLGEVGVSPKLVTEIVVVFRTFPIRVAGTQAGPLGQEMNWEQIRRESGYPYSIEERTSVTNKIRRVGPFDWSLAQAAVTVNRPTRLAINGLDYLSYRNRGIRDATHLTSEANSFVQKLAAIASCPVSYMGMGPQINELLQIEDKKWSEVAYARAAG
jgi:adenylosuccinate synthase